MKEANFKKYKEGRTDRFRGVYLLKTIHHLNKQGYVREDETRFGTNH